MTVVMCGLGFAMVGFFLPLTIYLQSVLGLSAVDAGLTIAPQPISMFVASGIAAGLSQKVSGKYLLIPGLLSFAAGMAYVIWAAHADAGRWAFLPGLIASGIGLGFTWTPVFSLATRDLQPHLAGAASGVINTIQELGSVVASAVIGAVLQDRLARNLHLPAGVPVEVARGLQRVTHAVFAQAFVDAMRPALLLTVCVMVAAAIAAGAVRKTPLHLPAWSASSEAGPRTSSASSSVSG
jgi:fucose permease